MKRVTILLLLLWNVSLFAQAQQPLSLSGKVVDSGGNPITGATLSLEGQDQQVSSQTDGTFSLFYEAGDTLRGTPVGYMPFRMMVTGQTVFTVVLRHASEALDEVVVVGYGTQRKGEITSSSASVKAEDFTKGAVKDAGQLIQGKVAG